MLRTRTAPRVDLMGLRIDAVTEQEAIDQILEGVEAGRGGWVVTPNTDVLRQVRSDVAVARLVDQADLVVADGMPIVWACRLQGTPVPAQVPGSSLIWTLPEQAVDRGASIFLLGGEPGIADVAAERLRETYPGLSVVGTQCPPHGFEDDAEELRQIEEALERAQPDIVFVGLGFPKQERLIAELRERFGAMWFLGVGISLSFVAGELPRAPVLLQRSGLEWLYRLAHEPRRLFRRYIVRDLPFAARMFTAALVTRARRGSAP